MQNHRIEITGTYIPTAAEYQVLYDCIKIMQLRFLDIEQVIESHKHHKCEVKIVIYDKDELLVWCGVHAHIYKEPLGNQIICIVTPEKQHLHIKTEVNQDFKQHS
jgi:hypothetical protein